MKQVLALLASNCPPECKSELESHLGKPGTSLLMYNRFINLPLPLVPLLHKSLHDDIVWAQKHEVRSNSHLHRLVIGGVGSDGSDVVLVVGVADG